MKHTRAKVAQGDKNRKHLIVDDVYDSRGTFQCLESIIARTLEEKRLERISNDKEIDVFEE